MTRAELKAQAKALISSNYWKIIGMTVLYSIIIGAVSAIIPGLGAVAMFFLMPIYMGLVISFVALSDGENVDVGRMFTEAFDGRYYLRRVGGYAWMTLFIFLWALLFVIPGIVKEFSYSMAPYILAKYPEIPAKDALKLSMKIMNGRKAELFVLYLSFIGWGILSAITFGIVGIFYVFPYMLLTTILWQKNVMKEVTDSGEFVYNTVA